MRGSMRKRGEAWEVRVYLGADSVTGKQRYTTRTVRGGKREAERSLIERGIVVGPDGLVEKDTKTHAARRVSLNDRTTALLTAHARVCRSKLAGNAFVFSNAADGSEPWFPDSVSRSFRRLCEREGLDGVRLHGLRPLCGHATPERRCRRPNRTVAGSLGHRNAATT